MPDSLTKQMFFHRLAAHPESKIALKDNEQTLTYKDLLSQTDLFAARLLQPTETSLQGQRIALLLPAGFDYVISLLGIWRAGGVAVPLNVSTSENEIKYALETAQVTRLFSDQQHIASAASVCASLNIACDESNALRLNQPGNASSDTIPTRYPEPGHRAMLLFTSGTTNKPKGVVTTHACLSSQINTLLDAWQWQASDVIPLFLPMHHVHGIINILCCGLAAGATVDIFSAFDMPRIFERVAAKHYTLFMAVPTIYVKMIGALENASDLSLRDATCQGFSNMRLMISGSAACPVSVHSSWTKLTQQVLLERYGMTEIGMALSNPYKGERKPGSVGQALPNVEVRLVDENQKTINGEFTPGEIWIKGPNVFLEYWLNPTATRETFSSDGWFKTGDIASLEDGYYRILGRSSVDIIKTGGEKVSALEIESALLEHAGIAECAVLGLPDETWGEAIVAAVVLNAGQELSAANLITWCKDCMSPYKVPKRIKFMAQLPRNAMGKITKPALKKILESKH
ncbi:MAG: acyl-CoA synthetase [Pseudomonadales bacterium]|nr:acyl-CoA synthetase [Pseudomonadales bacterium]